MAYATTPVAERTPSLRMRLVRWSSTGSCDVPTRLPGLPEVAKSNSVAPAPSDAEAVRADDSPHGEAARDGRISIESAATHAWVAKLVDARDLSKLSTRLGNGRREWGQIRWNSSTLGWLQYRAKPWFGACSGKLV